jgi:hypothetical protein
VQVEAPQRQLSRELGTDIAATPAPQTTRLVGLMNHKYSPAHLVTIEYRSIDHVYTPADFPTVEPIALKIAPLFADRSGVCLEPIDRARRYLSESATGDCRPARGRAYVSGLLSSGSGIRA